MRLGVDFGTTRTVVAVEDRGNYPLVSFGDGRGSWIEWYPSRIAAVDGKLRFGRRAEALRGHAGAWHLPSIKRLLGHSAPDAPVNIPGAGPIAISDLLGQYLASLRRALVEDANNVDIAPDEPLEAMISVPANANSNQRFLTLEAFKAAGFTVLGMMNEPSAAGVEYSHRYLKRPEAPRTKQYIAVYDLGGGTFDAAAIRIAGMRHDVVSSEGVEQLGGDDFDDILFDMVREQLSGPLGAEAATRLLDECRERKEALNPNTRKILVDTAGEGAEEIVVQAADYYARCVPLVEQTIACLEHVLSRLEGGEADADAPSLPQSVATVYLVGGSVNFPLVARTLRDRYGRRVQRSPYPHGAVAIGLAVASNEDERYFVRETLTRHFGVWREAESGARVSFDPIFVKDAALDANGGALRAERRYRPAHNIGHYRYVECSSLTADGDPACDLTPWDAICFPFDLDLRDREDLASLQVERRDPSDDRMIVEEYTCDAAGIVRVTLREESSGYEQSFQLGGTLGE